MIKGDGRQKRAHINDENGSWARTGADARFQSRFICFNEPPVPEKIATLLRFYEEISPTVATNSLIINW